MGFTGRKNNLKESLKKIKLDIYASAVLTLIIGVVLIINPGEVTLLLCRVLGVVVAAMGLISIANFIIGNRGTMTLAVGLLLLLMGAFVLARPDTIIEFISVVFGIVLIVHGVKDFQMAMEAKKGGSPYGLLMIVLALLGITAGVLCICDCFGILKLATIIIGIALIYDGITDILFASHTIHMTRNMSSTAESDTIDTEGRFIE